MLPATKAFQSSRCTLAREIERSRFAERWQALMPAARFPRLGQHRTHQYVAISHTLRAAYIFNPKAAHRTVMRIFQEASNTSTTASLRTGKLVTRTLPLRGHEMADPDFAKVVPPGYVLFTFVREPISDFVSGYTETVHRVLTSKGSRSVHAENLSLGKVSCLGRDAHQSRFQAFVDDVRSRRAIGYDSYHIWPQAVKLDVLPADGRSIDYIGRVETLAQDMERLLRQLGVQSQPPSLHTSVHVSRLTNVDSCGQRITVPQETLTSLLPVICDLLISDWACLGYPEPAACSRPCKADTGPFLPVPSVRVSSLRELAERAARYLQVERKHTAQGRLSTRAVELLKGCGRLTVPFNGVEFEGFEAHLEQVNKGVLSSDAWRHLVERAKDLHPDDRSRVEGSSSLVGYKHRVLFFDPIDSAAVSNLLGVPDSPDLVLRTSRSTNRGAGNFSCAKYSSNVMQAWLTWLLGEIRLGPRLLVVWPVSSDYSFELIAERWTPLIDLPPLAANDASRLASSLFDKCVWLACKGGLVQRDLKPKDMLVRRSGVGGQWEAAFTDFERVKVDTTTSCGCRRAATLVLSTVLFACGPLRHTHVATHFTALALKTLLDPRGGVLASAASSDRISVVPGTCRLFSRAVNRTFGDNMRTKTVQQVLLVVTRAWVLGKPCPETHTFGS